MKVKYFTKEQLIASNESAIKTERNRSFNRDMLQDALNTVPDETLLPVCFNMPHNDVEMRVQVATCGSGVQLAVLFEEFDALSSRKIPQEIVEAMEETCSTTEVSLH